MFKSSLESTGSKSEKKTKASNNFISLIFFFFPFFLIFSHNDLILLNPLQGLRTLQCTWAPNPPKVKNFMVHRAKKKTFFCRWKKNKQQTPMYLHHFSSLIASKCCNSANNRACSLWTSLSSFRSCIICTSKSINSHWKIQNKCARNNSFIQLNGACDLVNHF